MLEVDVAWPKVDDAEDRFADGDGEITEVAVMGEDDTLFSDSMTDQLKVTRSPQPVVTDCEYIVTLIPSRRGRTFELTIDSLSC